MFITFKLISNVNALQYILFLQLDQDTGYIGVF